MSFFFVVGGIMKIKRLYVADIFKITGVDLALKHKSTNAFFLKYCEYIGQGIVSGPKTSIQGPYYKDVENGYRYYFISNTKDDFGIIDDYMYPVSSFLDNKDDNISRQALLKEKNNIISKARTIRRSENGKENIRIKF